MKLIRNSVTDEEQFAHTSALASLPDLPLELVETVKPKLHEKIFAAILHVTALQFACSAHRRSPVKPATLAKGSHYCADGM